MSHSFGGIHYLAAAHADNHLAATLIRNLKQSAYFIIAALSAEPGHLKFDFLLDISAELGQQFTEDC